MKRHSRTRMGAWIETGGIHRKSEGRSRRTRMGAWIETLQIHQSDAMRLSHPYGCVD